MWKSFLNFSFTVLLVSAFPAGCVPLNAPPHSLMELTERSEVNIKEAEDSTSGYSNDAIKFSKVKLKLTSV